VKNKDVGPYFLLYPWNGKS